MVGKQNRTKEIWNEIFIDIDGLTPEHMLDLHGSNINKDQTTQAYKANQT